MRQALLVLVSLSHGLAAVGFWKAIARKRIPNMVDFACVSTLLYYDVGIWLEFSGVDLEDRYLGSLLSASDLDFGISIAILIFMPWLFHLGSRIANGGTSLPTLERVTEEFAPRVRGLFYWLAIGITIPLVIAGFLRIAEGLPIWEARMKIGNEWGVLVTVLYLPSHLLAFYVFQADSRLKRGVIFVLWLILSGIVSTLAIGERTNMLVPLVIVILFWIRPTLKTLVPVLAVLVIGAAMSLPLFKHRYSASDVSSMDLVILTVHNDLSRSSSLATAVNLSVPFGTKILPYPLAGYVYSAFFFMPRQIAPFKGQSTTNHFTGHVAGSLPDEIDWGLGIGVAEELLLNVGLVFVGPGFLIYGMCMGLIDRHSRSAFSLVVPTRLGNLFLCGYNLPSILFTFGTMALSVWVLDAVFRSRRVEPLFFPEEIPDTPHRARHPVLE